MLLWGEFRLKLWKKENLILIVGVLLLVGGSVLFFIKDRYPVLVSDMRYQHTLKEAYDTWARVAVVDEESQTILSDIQSIPIANQIRLAKTKTNDDERIALLEMVYERSLPRKNPVLYTDILKNKTLTTYALNISDGQSFNRAQAKLTDSKYLTSFAAMKKVVKKLTAVYNSELFVNFTECFYLYNAADTNFFVFSNNQQYLLCYTGEYLYVYHRI